MPLKVLFIFDKYLNRTMNWAHRLIQFTPDILPVVASPLIVDNEFIEKDWQYLYSPFQREFPTDEWSFSDLQIKSAKTAVKLPFMYKRFLLRKARALNPDVVHIHFGNVAWEYSALVQKLAKPLVATFHGYDYRKILSDKPVFKKRYQELFRRATIVTCGGSDAKNYLIFLGCPAEKIRIVHMAIDTQKVQFRPTYKQPNTLKLLQISSFIEKKGHIYTLRAFQKALQDCPNMTLTFIGESVDKNIVKEVRNFIEKEKLNEKITIIDSLTYAELLRRIPDFDVMIHPSVTAADADTECTPVSMMDVQAVGLPVISTFHADIPEVVLHAQTGLLAAEKDTEKLAEFIRFFYRADEKTYRTFAEAARQHVENQYDVRRTGRQMFDIYREVSATAQ